MSSSADNLVQSVVRMGGWVVGQRTMLDRCEDFRDEGSEDGTVFRLLQRRWGSVPNGDLDGMCGWLDGVVGQVVSDVVVDGKVYAGEWLSGQWWVERPEAKGGDVQTYNVVQVLTQGVGTAAAFVVESPAETTTTYRYEWASYGALQSVLAAIAAVGDCVSGSGVRYELGRPERERESRRWSAVVTKHSMKVLATGMYEVGENDFEKNEAADFLEVRAGVVDQSGAGVAVMTPGNPSAGVEVTQTLVKNADCTMDYKDRKRTVKNLVSATVRKVRDIFHTQVAVSNKADAVVLSDPAAASGGVVQTVENVKNGLQQFDTTMTVTTELPVSNAVVMKRKMAFETVADVENANQSAGASDPAVAGVTVTNTLTPGNLVTTKVSTITPVAVSDAEHVSSSTIAEIVSSTTDRNQSSAAAAVTVVASAGVLKVVESKETDFGKFDNTTKTVTEQGVSGADVVKRLTAFESVVVTENQNQASAAADPTVPGQTVENTKTPGALVTQKITAVTAVNVTDAMHESSATIFEITASTTNRNDAAAAAAITVVPSGGVLHVVESRENELGKFDNTTKTVTEQDVTNAVVNNVVTAIQSEAVVVEKGAAAGSSLTASVTPATGVIVQKQGVKTQGGLLDVTTTTKTAVDSTQTFTMPDRDGPETYTYFKNVKAAELQTLMTALSPYTRNSIRCFGGINDYGRYDGHILSKVVNAPTGIAGVWWYVDQMVIDEQHDVTDHEGNHWVFKRKITCTEAAGSGCQQAEILLSGVGVISNQEAGPGSHLTKNTHADTWDMRRVTKIMETAYTKGTFSGTGAWIPGGLTISGSEYQVWPEDGTTRAHPFATS